MVRKTGRRESVAGDGVRLLCLAAQPRHDLRLHPLHGVRLKPRLVQRKTQKLESLIAILGERLERAAEIVAIGIEMQIDRQVFELLVEGNGIIRTRAFVEHARQEMGDARLALRVLRRPAREGELNGDQRIGVILDEPGLDAAWRNHLACRGGAHWGRRHHHRRGRHGVGPDQIAGDGALLVEPMKRLFHLIAGHALDELRPIDDLRHREAGRERGAEIACQRRLAVALVDRVGDEPRLGALKLGFGKTAFGHFGKRLVERGLELFKRHALRRHGVNPEEVVIERGARVPGARRHRELALEHEALVEPSGRLRPHRLGQNVEGFGLAGLRRRVGRRQIHALQHRLLHPFIRKHHLAGGHGLRLLGPHARGKIGSGRGLAISRLGQFPDFTCLDVTGDDQDRIVGRIEAPVKGERIGAIEALDLRFPADDRRSIRVVHESGGGHRFAELRRGHRIGAHAALLEHDLALGIDDRVREDEAAHPISLEFHQDAQMLLGDTLKIGGVIIRGEGVLLSAELRHGSREFALGMGFRALEHEMLEEMRDTRFPAWLIRGAGPIPDHMGHDRRAVIGDHDDIEPIGEAEFADRDRPLGRAIALGSRQDQACGHLLAHHITH